MISYIQNGHAILRKRLAKYDILIPIFQNIANLILKLHMCHFPSESDEVLSEYEKWYIELLFHFVNQLYPRKSLQYMQAFTEISGHF